MGLVVFRAICQTHLAVKAKLQVEIIKADDDNINLSFNYPGESCVSMLRNIEVIITRKQLYAACIYDGVCVVCMCVCMCVCRVTPDVPLNMRL